MGRLTLTRNTTLHNRQRRANRLFFEVVGLSSIWLLFGIGISWRYAAKFVRYIVQLCQAQWDTVSQHLAQDWHLIVPLIMVLILGRGLFLFVKRLKATRRFQQAILTSAMPIPDRLASLLQQLDIDPTIVICFRTSAVQAFSLGAWQPKICVSTSLLDLLDDDELTAVLRHEAHHCRYYDPLRLLVSRLMCDIFFFVPQLCNLVDQSRLSQEMAADAAAIDTMGDTFPLASALHKLLTAPSSALTGATMAISQINVTERRILALVSPGQPSPGGNWRRFGMFSRWSLSTILVVLMLGITFLSEPTVQHTITTCNS